jgi:hypothetical protein
MRRLDGAKSAVSKKARSLLERAILFFLSGYSTVPFAQSRAFNTHSVLVGPRFSPIDF